MKLPFLAEGEAFWLAHFSRPKCEVTTPVEKDNCTVSYVYNYHYLWGEIQIGLSARPDAVHYDINLPFEECRA